MSTVSLIFQFLLIITFLEPHIASKAPRTLNCIFNYSSVYSNNNSINLLLEAFLVISDNTKEQTTSKQLFSIMII